MNKSLDETLERLRTLPFFEAVDLLVNDKSALDIAIKSRDKHFQFLEKYHHKHKNKAVTKPHVQLPFEVRVAMFNNDHLQHLISEALPRIAAKEAGKIIDQIILTIPK